MSAARGYSCTQRGADAFEVETEVVGDHVELVRGRELDVPPRVREQLRELGFLDVEVDDRRRSGAGTAPRPVDGALGATRDDLRQLEELDQRACPRRCAPGRTRRRSSCRPARGCRSTIAVTPGYTVLRRTRIWPSRRWSSISSIARSTNFGIRVEMLVDRGPDDDDDVLGLTPRRRVVGRLEPTRRRGPCSSSSSAPRFEERHLPGSDLVDGRGVAVEADDRTAGFGEREPERQPDVAAATDNYDILGETGHASLAIPALPPSVRPDVTGPPMWHLDIHARPTAMGARVPTRYHGPRRGQRRRAPRV